MQSLSVRESEQSYTVTIHIIWSGNITNGEVSVLARDTAGALRSGLAGNRPRSVWLQARRCRHKKATLRHPALANKAISREDGRWRRHSIASTTTMLA